MLGKPSFDLTRGKRFSRWYEMVVTVDARSNNDSCQACQQPWRGARYTHKACLADQVRVAPVLPAVTPPGCT